MSILLIALHVIVCFVLILVILLQAGRGQGLTGASFGGNVQSLLGTKATSFLTKATSVSAIVFLFTCIGLNVVEVQKSRSLFQPSKAQAPLDVEKIRKALEKVKASKAATEANAAKTSAGAVSGAKAAAATATNAVAAAQQAAKQ